MADNQENILVEFDYQNIAIIDPNKVIDDQGKAKERLVKHENLVMYANLECKVIPRTKLILGASNSDNLRTLSVTSMNFLNPGEKTFLDNAYTDELTGKDTVNGQGVNQQKIERFKVPNKTDEFYYNQITKSNGEPRATDNGLLGIKSITVKINTSFEPVINIKLEDVKGRALFESGNDSPYAAFFNLPYPLFYLTLKGYYGKAVRLPLMLMDFNSTYNSGTGNFEIDLQFYSYKFTIISEITMGAIVATPHMYKSTIEVSPKNFSGGLPTAVPKTETRTQIVEYGTQKIRELYSEYKAKGLIPEDFPEITVIQMQKRIDQFIQKVLDEYSKENLDPLTDISEYGTNLTDYRGEVYYYNNSWFNKYIDTKDFWVVNKGLGGKKIKIYTLSPQFSSDTQTVLTELKELVTFHNDKLAANKTCGKGGSYTIKGGDPKSSEIVNGVTYNTFFYPDQGIGPESIDFQESWKQQKGSEPPDENSTEFTAFQAKFQTQSLLQGRLQSTGGETPKPVQYFFQFEGDGTFVDITDKMEKDRKRIQTDVENELTNALASQIKSKNTELGFVPTIRNILAVIFANGEAFLRLLDEVHTKAWNQRDSAIRKAPIFSEGANPDAQKQSDNVKIPIYPWPEFVVRTPGEKGEEKFETKYPGDPDVINETKAFLYDYWPEVEFVEEYLRGITSRVEPVQEFPSNNEVTDVKRLSLNAIEYPPSNEIYDNKEETKYLFEIYERLILTSFYSKFFKTTTKNSELNTLAEVAGIIESTNIANSLGNENPFLQEKLLNYGFNENNFLPTLKQFSNSGVGQSWQNFERGIFNTPYIKNTVENNSFQILKSNSKKDVLGVVTNMFGLSFNTSSEDEDKIRNYITGSTNSSKLDFTDTYPFIDVKWDRKNMVGPSPLPPNFVNFVPILPSSFAQLKDFYDTRKNLTYNSEFKVISNFSGASLAPTIITETPKPFSSYGFKNVKMPSTGMQNADYPYLYLNDLNEFYKERNSKYQYQLPTEGDVFYASKIGRLTKNQTVSMLNTPFFTNAIQESITKFRNFDEYPYTVPAYLFLNSLPLSTLREKYTLYSKTTSPNSQQEIESIEYMNYIFATLKKYGAIHKISLPWVLKIGSIWHRYKKWVETGVDILDNSWKPFPYLENFDPITSAATTDYALTLENNQNVDIILQKDSLVGTQIYTQMSTGFYPETINDFNVFYQGFRLFTGFTSSDIQSGITSGLRIINSEDSNITVGFSGNPTDPDRYVQLNAWSAYVLTPDKKDCFILPSHGANINQISSECFNDDDVNLIPIVNNDYVFDGSVRSFWSAPTYGYFSTDKIVKPNPDEYLKRVFGGIETQETFSLRSSTTGYTNISEMFSVFERNVLDEFEKKFLSFSLPKYNYNDIDPEYTNTENSYGNFHLLFNNLMKIPAPPTGLTASLTIKALQTAQINQFAKVIKGFLNNEVIIKYGNPGNFDKKLFYSFSTKPILDSLILEKYTFSTPNALPSSAGTQTLIGSKLTYPEAWEALLLSIGFSDVDGIAYSNTGSTIFDFFIDNDIAFTPNNIIQLSPIIKIYATKKYQDRSLTPDKFALLVNEYIDQGDKFINKTLDNLFIQLRKKLDGIKILKERTIVSKLEGTQTKLELYQSFKATNDKWISGNDYKTKTLFEDVLLLDSASRNVGDVAVADIYHLRNLLNPVDMNLATSMYTIVNTILVHNKFTVFNVPSYVNFYNVQEATKNAIPKPEGTLELANNLFGTFLDVDYRKSSTKMVCFYPGEPSAHLDTQGAIQGWNSDAFDMRRAADNPLIEDQINKRDYDKSNKVVGFNVDIGPQNQGVFNTFSVSQKNGTSTAESLQLLSEMSRQAGNRNVATQNLSLYNLYKVRSYDCNVTMMGDAMIQPLMWFNLRYVPMFSGPYMIFEVSHNISPGVFTTSFTGVRQKINGPPRQLDFLQSLRTNLVEKIIAKKREDIEKQKQANSKNVLNDRQSIVQNSNGTNSPSNNSECSGVTAYSTYTKLKNEPKVNTTTVESAKKKIKQIGLNVGIPQQRIDTLQYAIFAQMYLQGGSETNLSGLENNYIGLDLNSNWGKDNEIYFSKPGEFFCAKRNEVINPYVKFDSIDKNIEFLYSRWRQRAGLLTEKTAEKIAIFVNTNLTPNGASPSNWFSLPKDAKEKIIAKVQKSIDLYDASR